MVSSGAHARGVARLVTSAWAIAPGQTVRLAKRTSNLFRPRQRTAAPGLDVSGLRGVLSVDRSARTADVQGMCTYEDLVAATLPHGLMPLVVPQLKTITLGGAVSGLGIEASSFRNGLPHESVLELDVLTGAGEVITATPDGEHADFFAAFPNSYGSLGYATRLRIELEPVQQYVALRHVRFADLRALTDAIGLITTNREWDGEAVDFLDGVMFSPSEAYLTLGRWTPWPVPDGPQRASDYTGQSVYYRSLRERERDLLTVKDYLWRWDTDWFWCSQAFGAQNRFVRPVWPRRLRRSDVYWKVMAVENRWHPAARVDAWRGRPARERVVQDVEIPLERTAAFLDWFSREVPIEPVWLCPLALRAGAAARTWPLYPLRPGQTYVNVGFWSSVTIAPGAADGDVNRAIERAVVDHGGHKSLYSDSYYGPEEFDAMYGGDVYRKIKERYDPGQRLTGLYEKAVRRQ